MLGPLRINGGYAGEAGRHRSHFLKPFFETCSLLIADSGLLITHTFWNFYSLETCSLAIVDFGLRSHPLFGTFLRLVLFLILDFESTPFFSCYEEFTLQ